MSDGTYYRRTHQIAQAAGESYRLTTSTSPMAWTVLGKRFAKGLLRFLSRGPSNVVQVAPQITIAQAEISALICTTRWEHGVTS